MCLVDALELNSDAAVHGAVLTPFTARDGENLALYEWPLNRWTNEMGQGAAPPRAVVLIVHGLGEHAGRYEHVARQLMLLAFSRGRDNKLGELAAREQVSLVHGPNLFW